MGAAVPGLAQLGPTLPELEGELWLLTHPDLRNTARVRAFMDYCAAEIAKRRNVIESLVLTAETTQLAGGGASCNGFLDDGRVVRLATPLLRRVKSQ